jgi:hypothetical protein
MLFLLFDGKPSSCQFFKDHGRQTKAKIDTKPKNKPGTAKRRGGSSRGRGGRGGGGASEKQDPPLAKTKDEWIEDTPGRFAQNYSQYDGRPFLFESNNSSSVC